MLSALKNKLALLKIVTENPNTQQRIQTAAAFTLIGAYKQRIFTNGLASDESQIGSYSDNPFYQNPSRLVGVAASGLSPLGKDGQSKFKNGKDKKTKYLKGGYRELRELTGRQSQFVDLNFSGSTQDSIEVGESGGSVTIGFTNEKSVEIMQGHEERYGKEIVRVTESERDLAIKAARNELLAILDEI